MPPNGRCAASGRTEDVALPSGPPTKARVELAASTFVPALAQINDQGATIRRIAAWNSFSDEQQDLCSGSTIGVSWSARETPDGGTVEVAHEALFREWTRLKGWLEPERARLDALRSLQIDALTWDRNGRDAAFLNHRDKRLAEAEALAGIEAYRKRLGGMEFDYLAACQSGRAVGAQADAAHAGAGRRAGLSARRQPWSAGSTGIPTARRRVTVQTMRPYMLANVRP